MSWASKRQFQYLLGLFLFIGLIVFIIIYPIITQKPTCSDGKQNGGEVGVDCGGACSRVCSSQASEPIILWSRGFNVVSSTYNLVAFVENQNKGAGVAEVSYEFRVYDTNNLLIGRRSGTTFIPPNQQFAVFEPRFEAGQAVVKSVSFEFTSPFVWVKKAPTIQTLPIRVDRVVFDETAISPTLKAQINNDSIYELPAFDVIAILYNDDRNAVNASKTSLESLPSNAKAPLLFTWPNAFSETLATQEILVQVNPFTTPF